jgi:serine/threonine-protein kinase
MMAAMVARQPEPTDSFTATQAQLTAAWDVRGIDVDEVAFVGETVVAPASRMVDKVQRVRTLPALLAPGPEDTLAPFKLGQVLGEGGMGVVRAAEQTALERQVAIKGLHEGANPVSAAPQLLREARVTGTLEHPNVVPVYALGRDEADRPMMVMKRIEGTAWSARMQGVDQATRASDAYLKEHLGTLVQVARAIHFAHQRGILHRDIKPENVMIGPLGEVYVVDWGIAVSLREGRLRGVPSAAQVTSIEGTPAYMSPEMAAADGDAIDERSDVYLLGATLHHILTGEPPHEGNTLMMVLTNAFGSDTKRYAAELPSELVAICHRAMARLNEDRYSSARDFANAVAEFLEHHGSIRLAEEAQRRLERLRAFGDDTSADRATITKLYTECRFAFKQALREWGGNEAARAGLRATLEQMIELELGRGAPEAAEALIHELASPPQRLVDRIERAARRKRRAEDRLAELERDSDYSFGARVRNILTYLVSTAWGITGIACGVLNRSGMATIDHATFAAVNLGFMAIAIGAAIVTRDTMMANATNRRVTFLTVSVFAGQAILWLLLGSLGLSLPHANLVTVVSAGLVWLTASFGVDRIWLVMPVAKALTALGIWIAPAYHYEILGVLGALGPLATASRCWSLGVEQAPSSAALSTR